MNYCPSCGTANRDGSRFCNECGHKLPSKTGIVCPMCSHMNPAENVYCDNCKARLVPVATTPPAAPAGAAATSAAAPIRKPLSLPTKPSEESSAEEPSVEAPPAAESEEPDWLVRLRAAAPKPSELKHAPPPEPAGSEDIPDWMKPAEGEVPDWFQRLAEPSAGASGPTSSPPPADDVDDVDVPLPDWMRELGLAPQTESTSAEKDSVEPAPAAPDKTEASQAESQPDWLQGMPAAPVPESEFGETPDWLNLVSPAAEPATDSGLPDWLRNSEGASEPPASPRAPVAAPEPEEEPDWLTGLRREPIESPTSSAEDVPDWLNALQMPAEPGASGAGPETPTAGPATPSSDDTFDWLAALREPSAAEQADELRLDAPPPEAAPAEADIPDWSGRLAPRITDQPPPQAEVPAWLSGLGQAESAGPASVADDVPDWLRAIRSDEPSEPAPPAPPTGPVSAFVDATGEMPGEAEVPDWLSDAAQPVSTQAPPVGPAELPAWLKDLGPLPSPAPSTAEVPFGEAAETVSGEVPDWVKGMQPGQPTPAFADEAGHTMTSEATAGLEAATIPSWLQALRPPEATGEAAAPGEGFVEAEGILAGLKNVLPSSPDMGRPQGALAVRYADIPASDLARAGLFSELLSRGALAPTVVKPDVGVSARVRARLSRWLIALLLVILAVVPSFTPFMASFIQLGRVNTELYQTGFDQVDALNAGQRALVVFDYEAFLTGEMDAMAEAFLLHLGRRGAQAQAVSLNPSGPALANRVLDRLSNAGVPVAAEASYYPGQSVGAQRALITLQPDLVVVLTGSPDNVRWWIEQAAAAGLQTPIVAGVSASAWPQAAPYVQSGQVRGSVVGLVGGLAYRRLLDPELDSGNDGLDRVVRVESLYLLQMVFAGILLLGLVVGLIAGARRAR